jgi:hypothetical protein
MSVSDSGTSRLGGMNAFQKGGVEILTVDDPKRYCFSNVFDVTNQSSPYDRVAVAVNQEYVLEAVRLQGVSPWFVCPEHDETILVMDGEVRVDLVDPLNIATHGEGAHLIEGEPAGRRMGSVLASRGNLVLLPQGKPYRFTAAKPSAGLIQTVKGPLTIERWESIAQLA